MKSIRLWAIGKQENELVAESCKPVAQTETEQQLEDLLVASPGLLEPNLTLIGRQTATPGGPLDLLGVDSGGRLVVFELKRGVLARDAVAQVLDYVSFIAELDRDDLAAHIEQQQGHGGVDPIEDFLAWYQEKFEGDDRTFVGAPRAVLVGLGVDERARRMTEFLAASGVEISLLTFHAFERDGQTFLARQVEVDVTPGPKPGKRTYTKQQNLDLLQQLARERDCLDLLEEAKTALENELRAYVWPNASNYSLSLIERSESGNATYRNYVGVHVDQKGTGRILLVWAPRALQAISEPLAGVSTKLSLGKPVDDKYFNVPLSKEQWDDTKATWIACCAAARSDYDLRMQEEQGRSS